MIICALNLGSIRDFTEAARDRKLGRHPGRDLAVLVCAATSHFSPSAIRPEFALDRLHAARSIFSTDSPLRSMKDSSML